VWKKEVGGDDPWLASLENEEDMEAKIGEAALAQRKRWVAWVGWLAGEDGDFWVWGVGMGLVWCLILCVEIPYPLIL
jgi:hypothetical protein